MLLNKTRFLSLVPVVVFFMGVKTHSADSNAGMTKAAVCTACHGPVGISSNDLWPSLAGQKEGYLLKQLRAFHDDKRIDPLMGPVAKTLSQQDMEDLAAYFAQLKPQ